MVTTVRYGFILEYVPDIEAAKQFFIDVIGLKIEREAPGFVQFRDASGAGFAVGGDESLTGTGEREIYWVTDDAEASYRELSRRAKISVPLDQKPFGKVFAIADPSGQTHFVIEFAANRPSQVAS